MEETYSKGDDFEQQFLKTYYTCGYEYCTVTATTKRNGALEQTETAETFYRILVCPCGVSKLFVTEKRYVCNYTFSKSISTFI